MFKNPFSFEGRIRRLEYGLSMLIYMLVYYTLFFISLSSPESSESPSVLKPILTLILVIPLIWFVLAQGAKRCHDRGNSGWWQLIPLYGFVLLFGDSEHGPNRYGPNPKDIGNESLLDGFAEDIQPEK